MRMSPPEPPVIWSAPLSPIRMLAPEPPVRVSAPVPPMRMLPWLLPASVLPPLPPCTSRMLPPLPGAPAAAFLGGPVLGVAPAGRRQPGVAQPVPAAAAVEAAAQAAAGAELEHVAGRAARQVLDIRELDLAQAAAVGAGDGPGA